MSVPAILRALILTSCAAALALGTWLGARGWTPLTWWVVGAFVVSVIAARTRMWAGLGLTLGVAYLVPVIFHAALGVFEPAHQLVWMAALFGGILGLSRLTQWSLPTAWRMPLIYWAAIVAATWPLIVWREADFRWSMLSVYHTATTGLGGPPPVVAILLVGVALTHLLGILFFDACFAAFELSDRKRFESRVVWPLFVGALLSSALAVYQGTVDINWLSDHNWPADHRAAGGLIDAGGAGALAAFWCALAFVLARRRTPLRLLAATVASGIFLVGMWLTGSRSAAAAGGLALLGTLWFAVRGTRRRAMVLVGAVAVLGCAAVGVLALKTEAVGPVNRAVAIWREAMAREGAIDFVREQFFDRGAPVGTMSVRMVTAYPFTGVGVGGFYQLMSDYSWNIIHFRSVPDNAQSWYRHELAELGLIGSVGWIWWCLSAMGLVMRTSGEGDDAFAAGAVKASLVSIAVVSAFAMPTQVPSLSLTVWVFVFWYLTTSATARQLILAPRAAVPRRRWLAVGAGAVLFAVGTAWVGWTELRPPYRALWADWEYWRGAYDPEPGPEGTFWWTQQESAIVKAVTPGYLRVTFWLSHPDIAKNPVQLKLWRQHHELIQDVSVSDSDRHVIYLPVPADARNMLLETWVSRTCQPAGGDTRTLGLAMADWVVVSNPPPGATVIR